MSSEEVFEKVKETLENGLSARTLTLNDEEKENLLKQIEKIDKFFGN